MWFVELDDEECLNRIEDPSFLPQLRNEVNKLGLNEYFEFAPNSDDCYITIFGGVITELLF